MSSEAKNVNWIINKATGNITLSKTSATVNVGADTSFTVTRNGNGVISVRSSDTSIATVTGTSTVVIRGVKEGSTTIIVSCAEGDNYTAAQDKTFTVNVQKQSITIPTLTGTSKTYSGSAQSVGIENEPTETYATLTGDKSATNVGSYSFTYTLTDTDKYKWSDNSLTPKTFNWNIEKQAVNIPTVSNTSKTYSGSSQSPTISSYDNKIISVSGNSATNAGDYTITMSLKDTNNYCWNDAQRSITNKISSWSIAKANRSSISASLSGTVTYNTTGTITISGNSENGTVTAVSANTNYVTVQSTTTSSVVVKCVNYISATTKVTITVAETSNYNQSVVECNVSTAKANGSITLSASSGTVTYGTSATFTITSNTGGGTLHVNSADIAYATASLSNTTVTVNCVKYRSSTTVITVTSDATSNYNAASATYTMTAKKANGSVTLSATSGTVTYGTPKTFTVTGNTSGGALSVSSADTAYATASLSNTTVTVNCVKYRSATTVITVTSAETVNYNAATATYTMTAAKAEGSLSLSANSSEVKVGLTNDIILTTVGDGAISVTSNNTNVATVSRNGNTITVKGVKEGTANITVSVAEGTNHLAPSNKTCIVTVSKIKVTIPTVTNTSKTYNGNSQSPTVSNEPSSTVATCTGKSATNVGDYTLKYTLTDTNKYEWSDGSITDKIFAWSIAKANGSVTLSATSGTVTYGTPKTFTVTGNTSGGTLSVSSADTTYATANISGNTITVNCVKYRNTTTVITVTSAATANYNAATATYTMTAAKAAGSVTLSATSGTITYGTSSTFSITKNTSGGALSVSSADTNYATVGISGNTVTVNCVKYRSATTVITVTSAETDNYTAASATYTMTAKKVEGSLTLNKDTVTVMKSNSDKVQVSRVGDGAISISGYDSGVATVSLNSTTGVITITGVFAGTTTITVSVAEGTNHTKPSDKTISVIVKMAMNDMTWEQIKQIAQSGKAAQIFDVGDYKNVTFPTEITLDSGGKIEANSTWRAYILGIDHNTRKEGSNRIHFCIGKTTNGKEICFGGKQMNSSNTSSGGWKSSAMKTWLNGTFYNALPSDLKTVITSSRKYTDNTNNSSNTSSNVTNTNQNIWLLAEFEVFGGRAYANEYEQNSQAQYDYYKNGNSRMRWNHSSQSATSDWWLRSPFFYSDPTYSYFCCVSVQTNNGAAFINETPTIRGVVPCFTVA